MSADTPDTPKVAFVTVEAGICGFACTIRARKSGRRTVTVEIADSDCQQIKRLGTSLTEMTLKDLFLPLSRNPAAIAAEKAGCHPSCAIPSAVLKAVEVAMDMALPKDVRIRIESGNESED